MSASLREVREARLLSLMPTITQSLRGACFIHRQAPPARSQLQVEVGERSVRSSSFPLSRNSSVTGVDPAPVMLQVARLPTRHLSKVRYVEGAAEAIPLPEGSASVVWSIATVHHWSDIDAELREVRRVVLPGGRLVAMERKAQRGARGHKSHGWTDEQATAFGDRCREHGFTDVRLEQATIGRRSTVGVGSHRALMLSGPNSPRS